MNFSTRGRYGLRALADMALHATEGPVALRVVAERQNISESYLEQVFTILRKAGLVRSIRGAQGGYELSRPAKDITAGEILCILEGPIVPVHCVDMSNSKTGCENEKACITRPFWEELRDNINSFLDQTSLQDIVDKAPMDSTQAPMYYI
jgi:Rrf2 family cysteine metabolism transcriptional repressor